MKKKLHIELPIENYPLILQEYGRAIILTNNVEYFLINTIKNKGKKIPNSKPTLGDLIKYANNGLNAPFLIKLLKSMNNTRIKLVHGTIGTTRLSRNSKEQHFIQKDGQETPINIKYIKKYSDLARNIMQMLITFR